MKTTLIRCVVLIIALAACTDNKTEKEKELITPKLNNMENLVSIVEIPTTNFSRAVKFYQTILGVVIEEVDMEGTKMGVLPSNGTTVNVALVKSNDYKPSTEGTVVYLNAGNDLKPVLDKIEKNGGQAIVPKTQISPEMGYFALFIDTEGNKLGLHSAN